MISQIGGARPAETYSSLTHAFQLCTVRVCKRHVSYAICKQRVLRLALPATSRIVIL